MSDVTVARLLGFVLAVVGIGGGWFAWAKGWTLFVPVAAYLLVLAAICQGYAWSWRQNSGPGSARLPAR
jgi:hypothetical protein